MISLNRPCPTCAKVGTVCLEDNHVMCSDCGFSVAFSCPICNESLEGLECKHDDQGPYFVCGDCDSIVHLKRLQNLLNNVMQVSYETRCKLCNGPTIYRTQANIGHRCFYFPKCSGQSTLFGTKQECLVFIDFETTGLEPGKDFIIEIGALKIDEKGFEHTFDMFIKPPISIPEKITTITKIDDEMLKDASPIEDVIDDFYHFVGDATLVAHNADFDIAWLIMGFQKHGLVLQENSVICTLGWAREMKEGRCSLSALTKKYKIGHLNAHRALADAAVTKELFFIYEDAQQVARPVKELTHYLKIVDKIQGSRKKTIISVP